MRLLSLAAGLAAAALMPGAAAARDRDGLGREASQAADRPVRLLVANVGNVNPSCQPYVFKLCLREVERRAARSIAEIEPDVLVLIEVLPDGWCGQGAPEVVPTRSCFGRSSDYSQIQELLGDGYSYRCDGRFGWDCVAVRDGAGRFTSEIVTAPAPDGCDSGFTVNRVDVELAGREVQMLAGHPDSTSDACRAEELLALFGLAGSGPAVLAGDFNLDPHREESRSVEVWRSMVGPGKRFQPHNDDTFTSIPAEASQLDPTGQVDEPVEAPMPAGPFRPRTIDHAASDSFDGLCDVVRIDGGGGMDHRALDCVLEWARS